MNIKIINAYHGNLKNINVEIPKNKLTVLTGVSGSGKSTLAVDVLFNECQRQYLEAMGMQGIQKPLVDIIQGVSPALLITQEDKNNNPRSTVGTQTDMYTGLRIIYEKLGNRPCPNCHKEYAGYMCVDELVKKGDSFEVYHTCPYCDFRHLAITRSSFSPNTKQGACPKCSGLGSVYDIDNVFDIDLSLSEGGVLFWGVSPRYRDYQIENFNNTLNVLGIDSIDNLKIKDFNDYQINLLKHGTDSDFFREHFSNIKQPKTILLGKFEGVYSTLWRRLSEKGMTKDLESYFESVDCDECDGTGINEIARTVHIHGVTLPMLTEWPIKELSQKIIELSETFEERVQNIVAPYIEDIKTKATRLDKVGLDYLTLSRTWITLSGGEKQRIKLASVLDSELTGVIYILDEPTVGLHPNDTRGMIEVVKLIRDKGNTVIVIEHDLEFIKEADYWIDMGPEAGSEGGEVVASGSVNKVLLNKDSVTSIAYQREPIESHNRKYSDMLKLSNLTKHNLKDISISIPKHALTSIVGVSGSGKSTLVFDEFLTSDLSKSFSNIYEIRQEKMRPSRRSVVATYVDLFTNIREQFALASSKKYTAKDFSFNTKGGRCERCEGLGYITENRLFFEDAEVLCPVCSGLRYQEEILKVKVHDLNISEVLSLSIKEASKIFSDPTFGVLEDVGLGYIRLGETLPTLSGGERQRLKLAKELKNAKGNDNLYVLDEPSVGLHKNDVEHFMILVQRLVDEGHTVVIVEHNTDIIRQSDYIVELGPSGGVKGGYLIFEGSIHDFKTSRCLTQKYL